MSAGFGESEPFALMPFGLDNESCKVFGAYFTRPRETYWPIRAAFQVGLPRRCQWRLTVAMVLGGAAAPSQLSLGDGQSEFDSSMISSLQILENSTNLKLAGLVWASTPRPRWLTAKVTAIG